MPPISLKLVLTSACFRAAGQHRCSRYSSARANLEMCVLRNEPLAELDAVMREISLVEGELKGQGRVLVRYSGTQSLKLLRRLQEFYYFLQLPFSFVNAGYIVKSN